MLSKSYESTWNQGPASGLASKIIFAQELQIAWFNPVNHWIVWFKWKRERRAWLVLERELFACNKKNTSFYYNSCIHKSFLQTPPPCSLSNQHSFTNLPPIAPIVSFARPFASPQSFRSFKRSQMCFLFSVLLSFFFFFLLILFSSFLFPLLFFFFASLPYAFHFLLTAYGNFRYFFFFVNLIC